MAVLTCKSESFPPVTEWVWYKITEAGDQVRVTPAWGWGGMAWASASYKVHLPSGP